MVAGDNRAVRECDFCGTPIENTAATVCEVCGSAVPGAEPVAPPPPPPERDPEPPAPVAPEPSRYEPSQTAASAETRARLAKMLAEQEPPPPVLASAAYNAGPGRARKWRADEPLEGAIYAETIPFNETRDYVKKVMSNSVYYSALFEGKPQHLKPRLGVIGPRSTVTVGGDLP